jgi:hypothetical protein
MRVRMAASAAPRVAQGAQVELRRVLRLAAGRVNGEEKNQHRTQSEVWKCQTKEGRTPTARSGLVLGDERQVARGDSNRRTNNQREKRQLKSRRVSLK